MTRVDSYRNIGSILLACLILMLPSLFNGFPLVYSDTGMYLKSGFEWFVPVDRPIVYGLLIRMSSFLGLWGIVIIQNLLLSFLLFFCGKELLSSRTEYYKWHVIICALLASFSSVGWYSGQVMPDIFVSFIPLSLFLIIGKNPNMLIRIVAGIICFLALLVHYSHIILGILIVLVLIAIAISKKRDSLSLKNLLAPIALIIVAGISLALINLRLDDHFGWSKGSSVFVIGKLLDSGNLQNILSEECDSGQASDLQWCTYVDQLPSDSRALLWSPESPIAKLGGWENSTEANNEIFKIIVSHPGYWPRIAADAGRSTLSQLTENSLGSGLVTDWYSKESSPPYQFVKKYFPNQMNSYLLSRQNGNLWEQGLSFNFLNNLNYVLIILSILLIFCSYMKRVSVKLNSELKLIRNLSLASIVLNALITGSLANVYDRLQSRISWIFILLALWILLILFQNLNKVWLRMKSSESST